MQPLSGNPCAHTVYAYVLVYAYAIYMMCAFATTFATHDTSNHISERPLRKKRFLSCASRSLYAHLPCVHERRRCAFNLNESKMSTARLVGFRELGIQRVYTVSELQFRTFPAVSNRCVANDIFFAPCLFACPTAQCRPWRPDNANASV